RPGAAVVRAPAPCPGPPHCSRCAGAHSDAIHLGHPRTVAAARLAGALGQRRGVSAAGAGPAPARPAALPGRPPPGPDASPATTALAPPRGHRRPAGAGRAGAVRATDERVGRLQGVPTIGPVTAAASVAAIDEASRFRHPHEVEAYLGLVPRELSSGETQRRGRITKAGSRRVRWLLIQAA